MLKLKKNDHVVLTKEIDWRPLGGPVIPCGSEGVVLRVRRGLLARYARVQFKDFAPYDISVDELELERIATPKGQEPAIDLASLTNCSLSLSWGKEKADAAYATYIGRSGCKACLGIDVFKTPNKRITILPLGVNNCQIDIPVSEIPALIALLERAK